MKALKNPLLFFDLFFVAECGDISAGLLVFSTNPCSK